jgi:hypothetical protein
MVGIIGKGPAGSEGSFIWPVAQEDIENVDFYQELYGRRVYRYDAVSGAQISVYFGTSTLIDDATAIQFALTQSKKPIFGYHSQYFDTVAPGVVIVHGRLFVNFIHQGYLRLLMKHADDPNFLDRFETNATRAQRNTKSGFADFDGVPSSQEALVRYIKKEAHKRQQDEIAEGGFVRPDLLRSVDIRIKYSAESEFDKIPFKTLSSVHFIGESQEIQISGQPVQEMYEFIAKKVT